MKNWVYIGRFQPFHNGHLDVLHQIIDKMDKTHDRIILIIGSMGSDSPRNPIDSASRYDMIQNILDNDEVVNKADVRTHIFVESIQDSPYNWTMFGKWLQDSLKSYSFNMENNILCGMEYIKDYANLVIQGTTVRQGSGNSFSVFDKPDRLHHWQEGRYPQEPKVLLQERYCSRCRLERCNHHRSQEQTSFLVQDAPRRSVADLEGRVQVSHPIVCKSHCN